ncbi:unnamed protein product [Effrenium voratum]|uniref:Cation/H+ exchanger transmembrane domain-containing protein n=1 Tax=Effrenium voratum TaxID=2562239 RepID=A0AA36N478_9DINO|nr:unnamed protein product [Effrenium voratum]
MKATISCQAMRHAERDSAPSWMSMMQLPQVSCNTSAVLHYVIQSDNIQPGGRYDVFCIDWLSSSYPPFAIFPACTKKGECGLEVKTTTVTGGRIHTVFGVEDFFCVMLLLAYVGWSYVFEKCRVLHETGAAVLVGLVAGQVMKTCFGTTATFSYDMFSYILLPMVIFAAGFNLDKKKFFRFGGYILALGVSGTVCIFLLIYFGSTLFTIRPTNGEDPYQLPAQSRLILASVLASTDTVAPMAFISAADFPQLYAVVFGEGVLNDVVSILLSTSVEDATALPPMLELLARLFKVFACSSALGVAFGLVTSLLFKHAKVLHSEVMKPVVLMLGCNYACYILTEVCEFSSIFALFVSSVLSGHYASYGMSEEAQAFASELAELMAYMAESVVFGYFGLTAVAYTSTEKHSGFQVRLIMYYIVCIVGARLVSVVLLACTMRLLKCGRRLSLSPKELCIVAMAGCMRGTIAYALILRAVPPEDDQTHLDRVMVTTVLGIVLVNCLVFGGLFPVVMRLLNMRPRPSGTVGGAGQALRHR